MFSDFEISNQDGVPVALYEIKFGNTIWRYNTGTRPIELALVAGGEVFVWEPAALADGGVTQGGAGQNDLRVTADATLPVVDLFLSARPSGKVWLTIRHYHIGDPDGEAPIVWPGTITNVVREDTASATLVCRSLAATYDRNGLRLAWSRQCNYALYEPGCFVDKEAFREEATVVAVSGSGFTVDALPPSTGFAGGFAEWPRSDGSFDRIMIESVAGNDFRTLNSPVGLLIGTAVSLYPGCSRSTSDCKKFNNLPNYGGYNFMPGRSPFDGSPVF